MVAQGNQHTAVAKLSEPNNRTKQEVCKKRQGGNNKKYGGSGLLEGRKRNTGVHVFAQQMLKHPQCLLRASGSGLAGERCSL